METTTGSIIITVAILTDFASVRDKAIDFWQSIKYKKNNIDDIENISIIVRKNILIPPLHRVQSAVNFS